MTNGELRALKAAETEKVKKRQRPDLNPRERGRSPSRDWKRPQFDNRLGWSDARR